ncbi:MAG: VWA domain-containing protein [Candidatus Binataceae bacterium]
MALMMSVGTLRCWALTQQGSPPANTLSIPAQHQPPSALPSVTAPLSQPQSSLEVPSLKLRSQPGYEQLTVTVTDSAGRYVTGLKEDDFRVLEDGQERPIGFFRVDRLAPVSIGIIVDCSGSMDSKMWQARTAVARLVDELDPRDDIFLESFANQARLLQPFTVDRAQIIRHLDFFHAQGQTALFDAVFMGLIEMRHAGHDKRVLLVVTDGMDNESMTAREQVIAAARAMKVLIYTIGIGDEAVGPGDAGSWGSDYDEVDMVTLRALAEETGARAFNLHRIGDGSELARDCDAISNELTQQYTVAYLSPDPEHLGYRTLHVDIPKHPELSVRVRKGVAIIPH